MNNDEDMKYRLQLRVAVLCALLLAPTAATLGATEDRPLWGYGVRSCKAYLDAALAMDDGDAGEYVRYEDWITGFVSGLNLALGDDTLSGSDIDTAMHRTRAYCKDNQDKDFFNAAMDLVRSMGSPR